MFLRTRHTGLVGAVVLVAVFVAGGFFVSWQFEWHSPVVRVEPEPTTLGRRPFAVQVHDRGKGLAFVSIKLVMDGESVPVQFQEFQSAVNAVEISVKLDPAQHKLKDGPGFLSVTAVDRSYWSFFRGNKTIFERPVTVDFKPPTVEVISEDRYVTQGGTGLVTYKTSPDTERSGIRIGDYFFPRLQGTSGRPRSVSGVLLSSVRCIGQRTGHGLRGGSCRQHPGIRAGVQCETAQVPAVQGDGVG